MDKQVRDLLETRTFGEIKQELSIVKEIKEGFTKGKYNLVDGRVHGICYAIMEVCGRHSYEKDLVLFTYDLAKKYGRAVSDSPDYFWWPTNMNIRQRLKEGSIQALCAGIDGDYYDLSSRISFLQWMISQYTEYLQTEKKNISLDIPPRFTKVLEDKFGAETLRRFKFNMVEYFEDNPEGLTAKLKKMQCLGSFAAMLKTAFSWESSVEGDFYWRKIYENLQRYDRELVKRGEALPSLFARWLNHHTPNLKLAYLHAVSLEPYNTLDEIRERRLQSSFSGAFSWQGTPEGFEFWSKLSQEWVEFLDKPETTGEEVCISLSDYRRIYKVACSDWRKKLVDLAIVRMKSPMDEHITLLVSDVEKMVNAASGNQTEVLLDIFKGKVKIKPLSYF